MKSEVRRWNNKRKRHLARLDAIKALDAFPCSVALATTDRLVQSAVQMGRETQRKESIHRLKGLIGGLEGATLGPAGQTQLEAYETAIDVIDAVRYTPPKEMQANWVLEHMPDVKGPMRELIRQNVIRGLE